MEMDELQMEMYRLTVLLAVGLLSLTDGLPVNSTGCDYVMTTDDRVTITSPNYPDNYAPNLNCSWQFHCHPSKYIFIAFKEYVSEWGLDVLRVYDGPDDQSRLIWTHSGDGPPPGPFNSTSNSMFITFETSESYEMKGFMAHYITMMQSPAN